MPISGASIRIDPPKMVSAANIIQAETAKIKQYYSSIASQGKSIKSSWEGENADIFSAAISKLNEQTKGIEAKLDEYYLDLTAIAKEYTKSEAQAVEESSALSTDVFRI